MLLRDVVVASNHEHLVLFDPGAIRAALNLDPDREAESPKPISESEIKDLAKQGLALFLKIPGGDCQATARIVVDEIAEPRIRDRAECVVDAAVLDFPSGKIRFDGVEFLCRIDEQYEHSDAPVHEIGAGRYIVEVLNLMPWKTRNRDGEIRRETTLGDRIVRKLINTFTWLGVLLIPANLLILLPLIFVTWFQSGWRLAGLIAAATLVVDIVVYSGFWILSSTSSSYPILQNAAEAELAFDANNPDIVIILRRTVSIIDVQPVSPVTLKVE